MGISSNVTAGKPNKSGAVYVGATTATLPTSTADALTGFTDLGYVSEDGITNSNSPESSSIKAWGGDTVLSTLTDKIDTFSFKLIEALKEDVLKVVYGDAQVTSADSEIKISAGAYDSEDKAWVIDMLMRGGKAKRIVIPNGKVSAVSDITYKDDEAVGYEITITCTPDANGNTHYEYIK